MKLFDSNMKVLEKGLDAYSKRAEALANNIANVNTPNYKRKDIQLWLFSKVEYLKGTGSFTVKLNEDAKPYFFELKNNFTTKNAKNT